MFSVIVHNLTKVYRLYRHPADRLFEILSSRPRHTPFVALNEISFEVARGETFGIIGANGAGKSTLLKILAGVLSPTSGEIRVEGRVAALLELGTGFHPELSGRENIYLSASLLGLPEDLVRKKEREIIRFAELEEFIDRPLKTYSSGMQVRLAFSVAVQVDPDILIVDEALSVGDQRFQKKSLDRILDFRERGKTILFCSHNMYHVLHLCRRAMWLDRGRIRMLGPAEEVVKAYEDASREDTEITPSPALPSYPVRIEMNLSSTEIFPLETLEISAEYEADGSPLHFAVIVKRNDGELVFAESTEMLGLPPIRNQKGSVRLRLPRLRLLPGSYLVGIIATDDSASITIGEAWQPIEVKRPPGEKHLGLALLETEWLYPEKEDC
ncbi:ABC transporter ATP-binding protein [Thermosulfurimonas sp. F29]|uniref:ABC transporter ATP-binding protein n=1 Tax=Thermosulfurimonas sp. F29 TaxID=2867247 RepID=UPI001C83F084|nr:ABC transporter ATP-binding protein [Thermosulfurimonas sp. F29]MBX6424247.1 ATP-binding cassette domain-containing protein [Thermosulfurimonas sp. F29]